MNHGWYKVYDNVRSLSLILLLGVLILYDQYKISKYPKTSKNPNDTLIYPVPLFPSQWILYLLYLKLDLELVNSVHLSVTLP